MRGDFYRKILTKFKSIHKKYYKKINFYTKLISIYDKRNNIPLTIHDIIIKISQIKSINNFIYKDAKIKCKLHSRKAQNHSAQP